MGDVPQWAIGVGWLLTHYWWAWLMLCIAVAEFGSGWRR